MVFSILKSNCRRLAKEWIENSPTEKELIHFKLDKEITESKDFKWIKPHEFRYRGRMYDIVSSKTIDGVRHVQCYHDVKEEKLIASYTKLLLKTRKSGEDQQATSVRQLLDRLNIQIFENKTISISNNPYSGSANVTFYLNHYKSRFIPPQPPPPEYSIYSYTF